MKWFSWKHSSKLFQLDENDVKVLPKVQFHCQIIFRKINKNFQQKLIEKERNFN